MESWGRIKWLYESQDGIMGKEQVTAYVFWKQREVYNIYIAKSHFEMKIDEYSWNKEHLSVTVRLGADGFAVKIMSITGSVWHPRDCLSNAFVSPFIYVSNISFQGLKRLVYRSRDIWLSGVSYIYVLD